MCAAVVHRVLHQLVAVGIGNGCGPGRKLIGIVLCPPLRFEIETWRDAPFLPHLGLCTLLAASTPHLHEEDLVLPVGNELPRDTAKRGDHLAGDLAVPDVHVHGTVYQAAAGTEDDVSRKYTRIAELPSSYYMVGNGAVMSQLHANGCGINSIGQDHDALKSVAQECAFVEAVGDVVLPSQVATVHDLLCIVCPANEATHEDTPSQQESFHRLWQGKEVKPEFGYSCMVSEPYLIMIFFPLRIQVPCCVGLPFFFFLTTQELSHPFLSEHPCG